MFNNFNKNVINYYLLVVILKNKIFLKELGKGNEGYLKI